MDGRLVLALLIETGVDGRPQKLELASANALLTLHPTPGGAALHGNLVRSAEIEHLVLPWGARHLLLVGDSPVTAAVAARDLAGDIGVGEGATVPAVVIGQDLTIRLATWRVVRVGPERWHLVAADGSAPLTVELDGVGAPANLPDQLVWPLELESPG